MVLQIFNCFANSVSEILHIRELFKNEFTFLLNLEGKGKRSTKQILWKGTVSAQLSAFPQNLHSILHSGIFHRKKDKRH